MSRRPPTTFEIVFKGGGVLPESIPWRVAFDALGAVQQLARDVTEIQDSVDDRTSLRLLTVKRGSAAFACYTERAENSIANLRRTGTMLAGGKLPEDAASRFNPLEQLSKLAARLGCRILIRRDRSDILATVGPSSYDDLVGSLLMSGATSIVGNVQRVGGATDTRCTVRIATRRTLLYCDVASEETARELGHYLYQDVSLDGEATWLKTNWDVVGFKVLSVRPIKRGSFGDAFRAIRAAGGDAWDSVDDPDALIREIRGQ